MNPPGPNTENQGGTGPQVPAYQLGPRRARTRGEVTVIVVVAVAVIGLATWILKPSWFPGASKRAAKSSDATAAVEKAVASVDKTIAAQGAVAAASVLKIGEVIAMTPESPAKSFISREVPLAASLLPPPSQDALLAAERRRAAVMEGRLEEARVLYEKSSKDAARLEKEVAAAKRERDEANAARRDADLALEKAAAAEHQKSVMLFAVGGIALLFLAGWIYSKVMGVSTNSLGQMVADIRGGIDPIVAIDTHLSPRHQPRVRRASKLATEPTDRE